MTTMRLRLATITVASLLLGACASSPQSPQPQLEAGGISYQDLTHRVSHMDTCDFNNDGRTDFVVSGHRPGTKGKTSVLVTDGERMRISLQLEQNFEDVVTGDWNADGHCDFAVLPGESARDDVRIFFGGPRGNFPRTTGRSARPTHPRALASGDITGDGKDDLVVLYKAFPARHNIAVFPGGQLRGGSLSAQLYRMEGTAHKAVTVSPGEGGADTLAVLRQDRRVTILENRAGYLEANGSTAYGSAPTEPPLNAELTVGDFDGDGEMGPVVLDRDEQRVFLFADNIPPTIAGTYRLSSDRATVGVADLDNDGTSDLLVTEGEKSPRLMALQVQQSGEDLVIHRIGSRPLEELKWAGRTYVNRTKEMKGWKVWVWGQGFGASRLGLIPDIRVTTPE